MIASELKRHLEHLTLVGQDDEGNLEWIGTEEDFSNAELENYGL